MMFSGHMGFVSAAYLLALVIVCGLAVWVIADYKIQRRKLADLEARGIVRRSQKQSTAK